MVLGHSVLPMWGVGQFVSAPASAAVSPGFRHIDYPRGHKMNSAEFTRIARGEN
jgi:hypothetical protein